MKKLLVILSIVSLLTAAGCRKYVEIPPEQQRVLSTASDYMLLMNNSFTTEQSYFYPVFSGDDAGSSEITWQNGINVPVSNAYTWADRIFGSNEEDFEWQTHYKKIFIWNTVIEGIMKSEGSDTEKQLGMSYALVHRAYDYFVLVNLYGRQYDSATASTDPAVPLVLAPKFLTDLTRASVQSVYDQITSDLNAAIPGLRDIADFNTNPSKAAAYALLARVNLHKRDFDAARRYAEMSLAIKSTLLDLNQYKASPVTFPSKLLNGEELMIKKTGQYPPAFPLSQDAENMYDKTRDLRYTVLTIQGSAGRFPPFTSTRSYNKAMLTNDGGYVGPSVPETILIKAECQARSGETAACLSTLNDFRRKRFDASQSYPLLSASAPQDALRLVIDERKREFVARGFRWFDQRRLSKDTGLIGPVNRVFKGTNYTLQPESNRYTYAIADKYIILNPEITQNPR